MQARAEPVAAHDRKRRQRHRYRDHHHQRFVQGRRQHLGLAGDGKHDEGELAALCHQAGKGPALHGGNRQRARQRGQQHHLERHVANRQREDLQRPVGQQAEVDRHADRGEEQPQQESLEWFEVRFERLAVFGAGQQDAGQEGAEAHRQVGQRHQLCDTEHQQQRERGEDFAQAGLGDQAQRRRQRVAADHEHRRHAAAASGQLKAARWRWPCRAAA